MKKLLLLSLVFINLIIGIWIGIYFFTEFNPEYKKYEKIEKILKETSKRNYDSDKYNCLNFSQDAQKMLKEEGINSNIIILKKPDVLHAVISIWFDPQSGNFVKENEYVGTYIEGKIK